MENAEIARTLDAYAPLPDLAGAVAAADVLNTRSLAEILRT